MLHPPQIVHVGFSQNMPAAGADHLPALIEFGEGAKPVKVARCHCAMCRPVNVRAMRKAGLASAFEPSPKSPTAYAELLRRLRHSPSQMNPK